MNNLGTINKLKKKTTSEKVLILNLLKFPTKSGMPMTVSEVSKKFGISRNTIYAWKKAFSIGGLEGLASNRKMNKSKPCRTVEMVQKIKNLVLLNPNYGASRVAKYLTQNDGKISPPTVQKVLEDEGMGSLDERYALSEKAVINNMINASDILTKILAKHNPCFADRPIANQPFTRSVYVDALPIERYFHNGPAYFLIATDLASMYTIGKVWAPPMDGSGFDFRHEISQFFVKNNENYQINIYDDGRRPFNKHVFRIDSKINFLRFCKQPNGHRVPGAYLFIINKIREEFIPEAILKKSLTIHELNNTFEVWLNDFNQEFKHLGFPTFGLTPSQLLRNKECVYILHNNRLN